MAESRTDGLHIQLQASIRPSYVAHMYLIQLLLLSKDINATLE